MLHLGEVVGIAQTCLPRDRTLPRLRDLNGSGQFPQVP